MKNQTNRSSFIDMLPLLAHRVRASARASASEDASSSSQSPSSDDSDVSAVNAAIAERRRRQTGARTNALSSITRPTFFELIAADRLAPSLKHAVAYAFGTLANAGAPGVAHYALDRGEEVFALLTFAAELKSFSSGDGSISESVYGLQRVPRTLTRSRLRSDGRYRIDWTQRVLSAGLLAFLPYVSGKCARAHEALAPEYYARRDGGAGARRRRRVWDADGDDIGAIERSDEELSAFVEARNREPGLRGAAKRAFVAAYPTANALAEAATFVAWTGYLLGRWNINDPTLLLVDCYVARALPSELEANARELEAVRDRQLARARAASNPASRAIGVGALRTKNFVMDYAQSALIAAVIGFKLTEWWYGAAEERVVGASALPVPPPPPRPPPHPNGIAVPADSSLCPLCRKTIRNPALLTCSGYVFCYVCLHSHVERYGDCPVSCHVALNGVDDIRRLYDA
jgi:peroxin-12